MGPNSARPESAEGPHPGKWHTPIGWGGPREGFVRVTVNGSAAQSGCRERMSAWTNGRT